MAGLCRADHEFFQQRHNVSVLPLSCYFKSDVFLAIQVSFQVDFEISLAGKSHSTAEK